MKPNDILFSPLPVSWRRQCDAIVKWIDHNRDPRRCQLALARRRPLHSLLLHEMVDAYHDGQRMFWRTEYPMVLPTEFEFDGVILSADPVKSIPFPVYGEGGHPYYRSIEDVNLVPNTYSHYYIFGSFRCAIIGLSDLAFNH